MRTQQRRLLAAAWAVLALAFAVAPVHAQLWANAADQAQAALPNRYPLWQIRAEMRWADLELPETAVVDAHAAYCDELDALLPSCAAFALGEVKDNVHSTGAIRDPGQAAQFKAHQQRLVGASDAAERRFFDSLAAIPGLDAATLANLQAWRQRRDIDRTIDGIRWRCSQVWDTWTMPRDSGASIPLLRQLKSLTPEQRARARAVIDSLQGARVALWKDAEPVLRASIDAALLERSARSEVHGGSVPPSGPPAELRARMRAFDVTLIRATMAALPPASAAWMRANPYDAYPYATSHDPSLKAELPALRTHSDPSPTDIIHTLLLLPNLDVSTRTALRAALLDWQAKDNALVDAGIDRRTAALAGAGQSRSPEYGRPFEGRADLARAKLKELKALLSADWLRAGAVIPFDRAELIGPSDADVADFGLAAVAPPSPKPPTRSQFGKGRFWATRGMAPQYWKDDDRSEIVNELPHEAAYGVVTAQVLSDIATQWRLTVEPLIDELQVPHKDGVAQSRDDDAAAIEKCKAVIALQPKRREAWSAATELDRKLMAGLEAVTTDAAARNWLAATDLARRRDASTTACEPIFRARTVMPIPNVVRLGIGLRGTPEERSQIIAALASIVDDARLAEDQIWQQALDLQDQGEQDELDRLGWKAVPETERQEFFAKVDAAHAALNKRTSKTVAALRRANDDIMARGAAVLPPHLAERWRRECRIGSASMNIERYLDEPKSVLYAIGQLEPNALPAATKIINDSLDGWQVGAERVMDEIDKVTRFNPADNEVSETGMSARRMSLAETMLLESLYDRLAHAYARVAQLLPVDVRAQLPQLFR